MPYTLPPDPEMINLMIDIATIACLKTQINDGKLSPYISYREAARRYGPVVVKQWRESGLIQFIQDKPQGKIRIDRIRIEAVSKSCNRGY